ncbi:MAG: hypothetical protein ACPLPR_04900 [Bacillota bacterium]
MKIDVKRVGIYALSFGITLIAAFGVTAMLSRITVSRPLARAYSQLGFVREFHMVTTSEGTHITVSVAPLEDLQLSYDQLYTSTAQVLGHAKFTLAIRDNRDDQLKRLFDDISLYIHEAIITGRFAEMCATAQAKCAEAAVECRIVVDSQRVYVSLTKDASYLYEIIPRGAQAK